MKILLVSHGDLAAGLCSTARNFFGAENVYSACVTLENGVADLKKALDSYLEQWGDEQVVICSDIKSGSANQTAFPYIDRPNTFLVSGMNLPLILQMHLEDEVTRESLHEMMEQAKEDIVLINDLNLSTTDEDDE